MITGRGRSLLQFVTRISPLLLSSSAKEASMDEQELINFDFNTEKDTTSEFPLLVTETSTIDLGDVLSRGLTASGSFNINDIEGTFLAKLLHALPCPAMLLDSSQSITFGNESWARFNADYQKLQGSHVSILFGHRPLAQKVSSILDQVFQDRKPRVIEQALQIGSRQVWTRMFLRSVRIVDRRFILCLIEDLTLEKRQIILMDVIKKAKTEWEQTVDVVSEGIALLDSEHRIIRLNRAMSNKAGISIKDALGQPCYKIIHGTDNPPHFCPFLKGQSESQRCSIELESRKHRGLL